MDSKQDGWVYILSNEGMPGLLKIGFTTNTPEQRASELHQTGTPFPFVVEYKAHTPSPFSVEKQVHQKLKYCRVSASREFFKCDLYNAVEAVDACCAPDRSRRFIRKSAKPEIQAKAESVKRHKAAEAAVREKYEPLISTARKAAIAESQKKTSTLKYWLAVSIFISFLAGDGNPVIGWSIAIIAFAVFSFKHNQFSHEYMGDPGVRKLEKDRDQEIESIDSK